MNVGFWVVLWVAVFSALGAFFRWYLHGFLATGHFLWGTLAVNAIGGVGIGLLFAARSSLGPMWFTAISVGGLGSLTTFSTFSMETILLVHQGRWLMAGTNVLANNFCSLFFCWLAFTLSQRL